MEWAQYNTGLNSKRAIVFNLSKLWGSLQNLILGRNHVPPILLHSSLLSHCLHSWESSTSPRLHVLRQKWSAEPPSNPSDRYFVGFLQKVGNFSDKIDQLRILTSQITYNTQFLSFLSISFGIWKFFLIFAPCFVRGTPFYLLIRHSNCYLGMWTGIFYT